MSLAWVDNAIKNRWIQVTVLPTARTGLATPDVFYFGNQAGETGNSTANAIANGLDILGTRRAVSAAAAPITSHFDFDRNARVDPRDVNVVRNNAGKALRLLNTIRMRLANDTGLSAGDGVTTDPAMTGQVAQRAAVTTLRGGFDATPQANFANLVPDLLPDGSLTLGAARLAQIAGAPVADGLHVLHLQATYGTDLSALDVPFTLDRTAPPAPDFNLEPGSDTLPLGDFTTTFRSATLTGRSEPV